jgi:hypothetical protein
VYVLKILALQSQQSSSNTLRLKSYQLFNLGSRGKIRKNRIKCFATQFDKRPEEQSGGPHGYTIMADH